MRTPLFRPALVFALALVLALGSRARAESDLDFTILNATGYDIPEIYLSPSGQKEWGSNVIKTTLKDGQTLELTFSPKANAEQWDIKAISIDGKTSEWSAVKLTKIEKLTLHWDKDKGSSATAE